MINVLFPQGCYGTFLSKCLYHLTNIGYQVDFDFAFDLTGSSHDIRLNDDAKNKISWGHTSCPFSATLANNNESVITILPDHDHYLDYFDNHFCKEVKQKLLNHLMALYDPMEINYKLQNDWNYNKGLDGETPVWILREWCSFWIDDVLSDTYNIDKYKSCAPNAIWITTTDLFENLHSTLTYLSQKLSLNLMVSETQINNLQQQFVQFQRFDLMQKKCDIWVNDVLHGDSQHSPCKTLFDEAYVQARLRDKGYEIRCNGLNQFPNHAQQMREIIYHV
jgi:hypothetical protein